jgi:AGZA family xanthine/uracil permease-like MFS transporter
VSKNRYSWAAAGDVNAFFGLMLDNVADMLLMVGLMAGVFNFPTDFALRYMIPGTAIGVLIGDLLFFALALRLADRTGRNDITAMPLGLDTPSTFGMVFFVLGPAYNHALKELRLTPHDAAMYTWQIGICSIFISGLFKIACAFGSGMIRNSIPRAGLLGSLAAIAAVVISFLPLLEILHYPFVGLIALAIILTTLVAKVRTPFHIPGALAALLVAGGMYWLTQLGPMSSETSAAWSAARAGLFPREWLTAFQFQWLLALQDSLHYLPIVIPLALATVVGGIDCTESAASVGDEYDTGQVIGVEAIATVIAAMCGGVLQTTPYIGHPAYKAMGGRAAYTLATALVVGLLGITGSFNYLYLIIPKAAVFPILVFVGLEITAQSFAATPKRHYAAVAISLVPALAALVFITAGKFGVNHMTILQQRPDVQHEYLTVTMLNNGFIITSLIWASSLAFLIDGRLKAASLFYAVAGVLTLFGVMHSVQPSGALYLPWDLGQDAFHNYNEHRALVYQWAGAYGVIALMLFLWHAWLQWINELPPLPKD